MPPIADPLFVLVALVALRVAIWIIDAARSRRRVAAVQTAAVRAGARPGPLVPSTFGRADVHDLLPERHDRAA